MPESHQLPICKYYAGKARTIRWPWLGCLLRTSAPASTCFLLLYAVLTAAAAVDDADGALDDADGVGCFLLFLLLFLLPFLMLFLLLKSGPSERVAPPAPTISHNFISLNNT